MICTTGERVGLKQLTRCRMTDLKNNLEEVWKEK